MQGLCNFRNTDNIIFIFGHNVPLVKQFEKCVFRHRLPWDNFLKIYFSLSVGKKMTLKITKISKKSNGFFFPEKKKCKNIFNHFQNFSANFFNFDQKRLIFHEFSKLKIYIPKMGNPIRSGP